MANKNSKAKNKLNQKAASTGRPCITDFALREKNPSNKRKSPWRGARKGGASTVAAETE